jgi:hypothetical protein
MIHNKVTKPAMPAPVYNTIKPALIVIFLFGTKIKKIIFEFLLVA